MNYSYFDYGYDTPSYDYFQSQSVFGFNLSFIYDTSIWLGRIDPKINLSIGNGATEFTQIGVSIGNKITLFDNLFFGINMSYKYKVVDEDSFYNNYSMILNLRYRL